MGAYTILGLVIKPGIVLGVVYLGSILVPGIQDSVSSLSFWVCLPIFLLIDDLIQYWYHRSAHEYPFLWKLHRAHHQAEEMGFFVSYRNALLYYVMMPNIWWVAIFTFLGGAKAVAAGLILKQAIIISSHSSLKYDTLFYKYSFLKPIIRFWERIFITPAFHHAHHGKSKADGISDPNGNFGNMFSLWDQLFGTAHYSHQFPTEYGLQKATEDHWSASALYPLVKSTDAQSELHGEFKKLPTTSAEPTQVELTAGKNYLWCKCGMSTTQPFCDGSHHGSKHTPPIVYGKKDAKSKIV